MEKNWEKEEEWHKQHWQNTTRNTEIGRFSLAVICCRNKRGDTRGHIARQCRAIWHFWHFPVVFSRFLYGISRRHYCAKRWRWSTCLRKNAEKARCYKGFRQSHKCLYVCANKATDFELWCLDRCLYSEKAPCYKELFKLRDLVSRLFWRFYE